MRYSRSLVVLPLFFFFIVGCGPSSTNSQKEVMDTVSILQFNIVVVPDLSNRVKPELYPKPVKDEQIIDHVLGMLYPEILTYRRSEEQKDLFRISFPNEGVINLYDLNMEELEIDFSKFDKQLDRINYIKGRSKETLEGDIDKISSGIDKAYKAAEFKNYGADIWSYFNRIDEFIIKDDSYVSQYQGSYYKEEYKNILVLLTDGYLEAGIYNDAGCTSKNECYFMSGRTISQFRVEFKASGSSDFKDFFIQNNYGIVPIQNQELKNLDILLLEAYDRSLDKSGNATVFPSDFEIMKLFWEDWMTKSGVRKFKMLKTASSINEASNNINKFFFDN
jgi:hypothetical protein